MPIGCDSPRAPHHGTGAARTSPASRSGEVGGGQVDGHRLPRRIGALGGDTLPFEVQVELLLDDGHVDPVAHVNEVGVPYLREVFGQDDVGRERDPVVGASTVPTRVRVAADADEVRADLLQVAVLLADGGKAVGPLLAQPALVKAQVAAVGQLEPAPLGTDGGAGKQPRLVFLASTQI